MDSHSAKPELFLNLFERDDASGTDIGKAALHGCPLLVADRPRLLVTVPTQQVVSISSLVLTHVSDQL